MVARAGPQRLRKAARPPPPPTLTAHVPYTSGNAKRGLVPPIPASHVPSTGGNARAVERGFKRWRLQGRHQVLENTSLGSSSNDESFDEEEVRAATEASLDSYKVELAADTKERRELEQATESSFAEVSTGSPLGSSIASARLLADEATEMEAVSDAPQPQPSPDDSSAAQSQATAAVMEQDERIEIASTPASGSDEDDHSMGWFSHYPLKKYSKR